MKQQDSTRARDIIDEIRLLCQELDRIVLIPGPHETAADRLSRDPYIGKYVRITHGSHRGAQGTVARPRGVEFYYIHLDSGTEIYKKPHNFRVVRRPAV